MSGMFAEQAHSFASSDRELHAEWLLTNAVREARAAFRVAVVAERKFPGMDASTGLFESVARALGEAEVKAATILGRAGSSGDEAAS